MRTFLSYRRTKDKIIHIQIRIFLEVSATPYTHSIFIKLGNSKNECAFLSLNSMFRSNSIFNTLTLFIIYAGVQAFLLAAISYVLIADVRPMLNILYLEQAQDSRC